MPARALKRVVLPVLGLPTKAMVGVRVCSMGGSVGQLHGDSGRFASAQAKTVVTQTDFHRIAQRREADEFNFVPFQKPHLKQPLYEAILSLDALHPCPAALLYLIEGGHGVGHVGRPRRGRQPISAKSAY